MMIGVGLMLLAVAGDETRKERITTFVGLAFVVPGIVLLLVAGGLRWYRGGLDVEAPDALERGDVLRGDLIERTVAVGSVRVVGDWPIGAGLPVRRADYRRQRRRNYRTERQSKRRMRHESSSLAKPPWGAARLMEGDDS